jgi:beta-glucanase (GH16 family)
MWICAAVASLSMACGGSENDGTAADQPGAANVITTAFSDQLNSFNPGLFQERSGANGAPFNCGFLPNHISFSGGIMSLRLDNVASAGKPFSCGEYRTISTVNYGRFETRMQAAKASGIVSSFFTYTGSPWDEIDVEILGKNTTQVQFNYFKNGVGGHEHLVNLGFDAAAGFHTYAIDWRSTSISWYVDGVLKYTVTGNTSTLPSHPGQVMVNLWNGIGVNGWLGAFTYAAPLLARYDYITYTP